MCEDVFVVSFWIFWIMNWSIWALNKQFDEFVTVSKHAIFRTSVDIVFAPSFVCHMNNEKHDNKKQNNICAPMHVTVEYLIIFSFYKCWLLSETASKEQRTWMSGWPIHHTHTHKQSQFRSEQITSRQDKCMKIYSWAIKIDNLHSTYQEPTGWITECVYAKQQQQQPKSKTTLNILQ